MSRSKFVALGFGLSSLICDFGAAAQDEATARILFERGIEAMQRRDFIACSRELAVSQQLVPKPVTLYYLATCEWVAGKIASADVHFEQFISDVQDLSLDKQAKQLERIDEAEKIRHALRDSIPKLTLVLPASAPPGVRVVCDGVTLTQAMLGVQIPVDPGEHIVMTEVSGGSPKEHRISIERNEKKHVTLALDQPMESAKRETIKSVVVTEPLPRPRLSTRTNALRTGGFVALGVGLTGLTLFGVTGLIAKNDKATANEVCPPPRCEDPAANTKAREAWNRGTTAANLASVGLGLGAAGVVVGTAMLIASSGAEKRDSKKAGLVLEAGPLGISLGVQGVFQ